MWIPNLNLIYIGWVLTGTEFGIEIYFEKDEARAVGSELTGWTEADTAQVEFWGTESVLLEDWVDKEENPGGTRGTEAVSDTWDVWEMEETEGGERFGVRLK